MRLRFRRVLLATILAIAAWWVLGWLLAVRPNYTLRYAVDADSASIKKTTRVAPARSFGYYVNGRSIRPFDRDGQYMLLNVPVEEPGDARYEIRRTANGELIKILDFPSRPANDITQADKDNRTLFHAIAGGRWFTAEGALYLVGADQLLTEVNVITGRRRTLGAVPRADHYVFSRDGSTLLLFDDVWASHFLALSPQTSLATANLLVVSRPYGQSESPVWRRYRVYSLPDLSERIRGWLPPSRPNTGPSTDFMVPSDESCIPFVILGTPGQPTASDQILLVNGRTDDVTQVAFLAGLHIHQCYSLGGPFLHVIGYSSRDPRRLMGVSQYSYRLPAGPWFDRNNPAPTHFSLPIDIGNGISRYAEFTNTAETGFIKDVLPDGSTRIVSTLPNGPERVFNPILVPGMPYLIAQRHGGPLPAWLKAWLDYIPSLRDALNRNSTHSVLVDYSTGRDLWRTRYTDSSQVNLRLVGSHLVESHLEGSQHVVNVLALPVAAWSPWWPRVAGFVVLVLVLFARRRLGLRRSGGDATMRA
jgi:hypothetical protein